MSNLRQCGLALQMYANESRGVIPLYYNLDTGMTWAQSLVGTGFLPAESDALVCPGAAPGKFGVDILPGFEYRVTYGMATYWLTAGVPTGYAFPEINFVAETSADPSVLPARPWISLYKIMRASETWLLADSVYRLYVDVYPQYYFIHNADSNAAVHLRHSNERANTLRADGSVQLMTGDDLDRGSFPSVFYTGSNVAGVGRFGVWYY